MGGACECQVFPILGVVAALGAVLAVCFSELVEPAALGALVSSHPGVGAECSSVYVVVGAVSGSEGRACAMEFSVCFAE